MGIDQRPGEGGKLFGRRWPTRQHPPRGDDRQAGGRGHQHARRRPAEKPAAPENIWTSGGRRQPRSVGLIMHRGQHGSGHGRRGGNLHPLEGVDNLRDQVIGRVVGQVGMDFGHGSSRERGVGPKDGPSDLRRPIAARWTSTRA